MALEEGRIDDFTPEYPYPGTNDPPGVDDSVDEYGSTTEDPRGEEITPGEVITESPGPDDIIGTGGTDDDFPPYIPTRSDGPNVDVPIGDTGSFHEDLMAQINEYDVDDKTRFLLEYLIGSLNDQGFIDTPLSGIVDDIEFHVNVDVTEEELEHALGILQQFEPCGIGARNLQECLLLQINQKLSQLPKTEDAKPRRTLLELERRVVSDHFEAFRNNNYDKIMVALGLNSEQMQAVKDGISRLNPTPGVSLNESSVDRVMTIIPDFIIETDGNGIDMWLEEGNIPPLHISRDDIHDLQDYEKRKKTLSKFEKEAYVFTKKNVEDAKMFIDAINQRRHTLYVTMEAIIKFQREFFLTQDDDQLKPMILQDIANLTHLDISTVSRVCNSKYCTINGTVYSLKYFFGRAITNGDGEDINSRDVKREIQSLIDAEDKRNPLSDEAITKQLNDKGFHIKRRTVAKYRDQMGISIAKLRKEITT